MYSTENKRVSYNKPRKKYILNLTEFIIVKLAAKQNSTTFKTTKLIFSSEKIHKAIKHAEKQENNIQYQKKIRQ